ncbi:MAG TPA: class I SAM-dependent methyltransferase [Pseudonocardiaceae bacterium]|nr:class I SAM-dependent methyltransferase [Pseudonocardiaceae bacterium]
MSYPGYYETEAVRYDRSRGGDARAEAAARAVRELLPEDADLVLDVAGGTGIVGSKLNRTVFSVDRSPAMSAISATRLPGRVLIADATSLPIRGETLDAVSTIWLLHLLPDAAPVIAEAARVLRPGGTLVTTVHKSEAHYTTPDDVGELLGPRYRPSGTDSLATVTELAGRHGCTLTGRTTFTGLGQGRGPGQWQRYLVGPTNGWVDRDDVGELVDRLAALPDQDRRRADPEFTVAAFTKRG